MKKITYGAASSWVQFRLLRLVVFVFGRISLRGRLRLASVLSRIAARWIPIRRKVARENIKLAFPDWTDAARQKVLVAAYATIIGNFLDLLAMARATREQIIEGVDLPAEERAKIESLKASGKGFVIVAAHIGNWEWGGAYLATLGFDFADVAKPLQNSAANRFVSELREKFGIKLISTTESSMKMIGHVRNGGVLSLLSDQNARRDGVFVPFFGRDASTVSGAGFIAYRLGVPILPIWCQRTTEGKIRGIVDDAIWADRSKPIKSEIERITRLHVASLERAVRNDPGQYFWFHRRWKTRPPESLAGTAAI